MSIYEFMRRGVERRAKQQKAISKGDPMAPWPDPLNIINEAIRNSTLSDYESGETGRNVLDALVDAGFAIRPVDEDEHGWVAGVSPEGEIEAATKALQRGEVGLANAHLINAVSAYCALVRARAA